MVRPATGAWVAVAVVALLGSAGCSGGGSDPSAQAPPPSPTPLAALDTTTLTIARDSFCARVAPAAIEAALDSEVSDSQEWTNGQRAEVADGVTDVAHEFGCRWTGLDGTTAAGWVFAPPVTTARARVLVRDAVGTEGCTRVPGAAGFGSPSVAVRCDDGATTYHGLVGDAWLSCSLQSATSEPPEVARAEDWCATVVQAATA